MVARRGRWTPLSWSVLWGPLIGLLLGGSALATSPKLVVLPLSGNDSSGVAEALRGALAKTKSYEVQSEADTLHLINAARELGLDCAPGDVECAVKLGVLGEIPWLLAPWITADDKGAALDLVLIDVGRAREKSRVQRRLTGNPAALAKDALRELLDPEGYFATLTLEVSKDGAAVLVDGVSQGESPLSGPLRLRPGAHTVRVVLDGYQTFESKIPLKPGQKLPLKVELAALTAREATTQAAAPEEGTAPNPWVDNALNPFVLAGVAATVALAIPLVGLGAVGGAISAWVYVGGATQIVPAAYRGDSVQVPGVIATWLFWIGALPLFVGAVVGTSTLYGVLVFLE